MPNSGSNYKCTQRCFVEKEIKFVWFVQASHNFGNDINFENIIFKVNMQYKLLYHYKCIDIAVYI